jgi:phospholipid/cholesterol/gamma-HCH transport system substrate-binding protein
MPSRERVNWAKIRVTAVSLAALAILFTLIYLLSGGTLFEEKSKLYLYIPDATGLDLESPVSVDGITVGKVSAIGLSGSSQPNRVIRLALSVERAQLRMIPSDSFAAVDSLTMIGDKYIAITSGRSPAPIAPGSELPFHEKADLSKRLDMSEFEKNLRDVDAQLTDIEQGRSLVGQFIVGDQAYRDIEKRLTQIQGDIRLAVAKDSPIGQALYTDTLYRKIDDTIKSIDRSLADLQSGQGPMGQFLVNPAQYERMLVQFRDVHKTISDVRSSEFIQSDAAYARVSKQLDALLAAVQSFNANPLLTSTADYETITGMAREFNRTVHEFRQDPKKFLRLKVF